MSVVAIVPSRGRPARAWEAVAALLDLAARVDTAILLVVDRDDPALPEYRGLDWSRPRISPLVATIVLEPDETGDLVRATNTVSLRIARSDPGCVIGNLGDDHRVRTPAWDRLVLHALEARPGVAYGDDLHAGPELPTAPFISAQLVLALGWYALPACRHMFIDNAWLDVGRELERLVYLPDLVIEHLHPLAGKAERDAGYDRADEGAGEDLEAYTAWRAGPMADDLARVRAALG